MAKGCLWVSTKAEELLRFGEYQSKRKKSQGSFTRDETSIYLSLPSQGCLLRVSVNGAIVMGGRHITTAALVHVEDKLACLLRSHVVTMCMVLANIHTTLGVDLPAHVGYESLFRTRSP